MNLPIRFHKLYPILLISSSSFVLFTAFVTNKFSVNAITGCILLFVGILSLSNPIAVVTDKEVEAKNLLGITMKRHFYESGDLKVTEKGLFIKDKKIVGRFPYRKGDFLRIKETIEI